MDEDVLEQETLMRHWLARQLWKPWVAGTVALVLFVLVMGALRFGLHAILDGGGTPRALIVGAILLPAMLAFGWWWDRKGY